MGNVFTKRKRQQPTASIAIATTAISVRPPPTLCSKCNQKGQEFQTYSRDGTQEIPMCYCKKCGNSWRL